MPIITQAEKTKYDNGGIGENQTWQDVLSSRVVDTEYTNNTGKPIMVAVTAWQDADSVLSELQFYVNSLMIASQKGYGNTPQNSIQIIVPNGSTYKVSLGVGDSIAYWTELR